MAFAHNEHSPLSDAELEILEQARLMQADEPPKPWNNHVILPAAGVIAAGWDRFENIVLISGDGYSVNDPSTGIRKERNRDFEVTFKAISSDYLHFTLPHREERIQIFGINAGDGIHFSHDGWSLELIHPWWPQTSVILRTPFEIGSGKYNFLDRAYMIRLLRLEGWLKTGFSPSGKYFAVFGSAGAESFSRPFTK